MCLGALTSCAYFSPHYLRHTHSGFRRLGSFTLSKEHSIVRSPHNYYTVSSLLNIPLGFVVLLCGKAWGGFLQIYLPTKSSLPRHSPSSQKNLVWLQKACHDCTLSSSMPCVVHWCNSQLLCQSLSKQAVAQMN